MFKVFKSLKARNGGSHSSLNSNMVTMNADKAAIKRKPDPSTSSCSIQSANEEIPSLQQSYITDESPNLLLYKRMEKIIEKMQDETSGVPVRTVKSFMSKIPSVFTGSDLITWMVKNLDVEDQQEALHLAHLIAAHAVYLCKRTMQNKTRLELADYEAENLARLQKMFSRKWEFIFMQAEAQSKVDKKRDKLERKVLDSQERAFWDVHRPMPGCVNTTEVDIKKACQMNKPSKGLKKLEIGPPKLSPSTSGLHPKVTVESLHKQITLLKTQLERRNIKVSKAAETYD
ncbi:hypothetical protein D910_02708 [Dendroctonus ponderosae]|uniref:DEP domain-containing protein n=1 Tax=Dendroctonus ponderosae TaxID=77166 RepID=U4TWU6_DENPD|nr:hypothetical protein D910_02708 [Dendroctonus ponderosae]